MILLFGLPRSGTSWIGKLFDSHPDTLYRHEPDSWCNGPRIPIAPSIDALDRLRSELEEYVKTILALRFVSVSAKLPILRKSYYPFPIFLLRRLSAVGAQLLVRFLGEIQVPDLVLESHRGRIRIVWKSIESIGRLGLFVRLLTDCQAIVIVRHPCGQIASVLRGETGRKFGDPEPSSEDYGILEALLGTKLAGQFGLTKSALLAMHPVERLAWRWVLFNEKALLETEGLANCMILRYEDLCANPLGTVQKMFAFTSLDWNEQTRRFLEWSVGNEKRGYYSLAKDPLRAAHRWQDELSAENVDRITSIARRSRVGRMLLEDVRECCDPLAGAPVA